MEQQERTLKRKGWQAETQIRSCRTPLCIRLNSEENGHFDIHFQKSGFKERSKIYQGDAFRT